MLYLALFFSGAAALVYQVTWHRYLMILLGAQAQATATVLAIFLGGTSLGYWAFGRWSRVRRWNLLTAFAIVEVLLGIWGLMFPLLFRGLQGFSTAFYGRFGVESTGIDWLISVLLLGLPTFLMGGTLPLLTQGLSESLESSSRTHAKIYGFNTVGACAGALLAGYFLLPRTDFPTALRVASSFNFFCAGVAYFLFARGLPPRKVSARAKRSGGVFDARTIALFWIGFLSGFVLLTLENVFIRWMALFTGASNENFTLVVAVFVLSLGLGSLRVRRIGSLSVKHLLWNQLAFALTLVLLYFTIDFWGYWTHLLRISLRDLPTNFGVFQALMGFGFFLLMLIPLGLGGITLPLCFHLLKDRQETLGERVGQLYAINMVGCVLGAYFGGFWLLNYLNLDQVYRVCVALVLLGALGLLFSMYRRKLLSLNATRGMGAAATLLLLATLSLPELDRRMALQLFRQQQPTVESFQGRSAFVDGATRGSEYLYYHDGPNSSIGVIRAGDQGRESSRALFVNGKSEGSSAGDRLTMSLTGIIPGLLSPQIERVCVVGFGTGLTVGELVKFRENRTVDVAEISGTLIQNASLFDPVNGSVSQNPKVRFHEMDAFRLLAGPGQFDLIISEPSNPWVSGVENLYSTEFYEAAKKRLTPDGVFVQWVQLYSFNNELLRSVLATLTSRFPYVRAFKMLDRDIALVASQRPLTQSDLLASQARWEGNPAIVQDLTALGIPQLEVLLGMELLTPMQSVGFGQGGAPLGLERPRLSYGASRARFLGVNADLIEARRASPYYIQGVADSLLVQSLRGKPPSFELTETLRKSFCEHPVTGSPKLCGEVMAFEKFLKPQLAFEVARPDLLSPSLARSLWLLGDSRAYPPKNTEEVLALHGAVYDFAKTYSPLAPLPTQGLESRLHACIWGGKLPNWVGECLAAKLTLLGLVSPESENWHQAALDFRSWFAQQKSTLEGYSVFAEVDRSIRAQTADRSFSSTH